MAHTPFPGLKLCQQTHHVTVKVIFYPPHVVMLVCFIISPLLSHDYCWISLLIYSSSSTTSVCYLLLTLRANTSICPRLSAAIFVCAENVVNMDFFCIMANFMLNIGTHSIGTCAGLLHIHIMIMIIIIIIIKPLLKIGGGRIKPWLKIFNECKSLTGVGELNPDWMKIFNECRGLTGVGKLYSLNTLVDLPNWM